MSKKTFRGFIAVLILVIVGAIICACGYGSQVNGEWFKNPDPLTWFNSWGKGDKLPDNGETNKNSLVAVASDGTEMHSGCVYVMPASLAVLSTEVTSSSYAPESEIIVYASLTNQYIRGYYDYSISFKNSNSNWATGKNVEDYTTIEPVENDERAVKIKFLQPFAEQIQLNATLRGSSKTGVCLIDYIKDCVADNETTFTDITDLNDNDSIKIDFYYGVGTVNCDYYISSVHVNIAENFETKFYSYLTFVPLLRNANISFTDKKASIDVNEALLEFYYQFDYSDFLPEFESYSEAQKQAIYYAWYHASCDLASDTFDIGFNIDCYYNGQKVNRIVNVSDGTFDLRGAAMGEGIEPDVTFNTNVIF